ncbi:MAG: TetR family transcriptional regulator [Acidobacteriia bacterium]|nr:TetR family transcriptional regulator [Terriglobia bacterium]
MEPNRVVPSGAGAQSRRGTLERLFDNAAALFWEKGYAATSTREIAAALGIQQASLYYHIASKEDLFYQLCVTSLEQLRSNVESSLSGADDPVSRIHAFIRAHLATLLTYQVRHVTMLTELRALSDGHHKEVLALRKSYALLVRSLLEEAQGAGAIRKDIPARYLYLALLNVLNWAVLWFRRDRELPVSRLTEIFRLVYLYGAASPQVVAETRSSLSKPAPNRTPQPRLKTEEKTDRPAASAGQPTFERMLETAAALFSNKGYAATSTREIAAILRIQKPSLYYHIQSKEDLLYTICKSSLDKIRKDVEQTTAAARSPLDRVSALVRAHIESMLRDQTEHAATLSEMRALSKDRLAEVVARRDAYERLVRSILLDAQKGGVLRSDIPAKYLCLYLLGLMNRVEIWFRPSGPLSPRELAEIFISIFLTGTSGVIDD